MSKSIPSNRNGVGFSNSSKPSKLHNELLGYEADELKLLVNGFTFGFRLGCVKSPSIHLPHNYKSTYEHRDVIEEYIHTGLSKQRIAGPFLSLLYLFLKHLL